MNTLFTDIEAAIEEGDFIQNKLKKTALLVVDEDDNMYVITDEQYERPRWSNARVLEIFHRGGSDAYKRVLLPIKKDGRKRHSARVSQICDGMAYGKAP